MQSKFLFAAALSVFFSGCVMWDAGYTENRTVSRYKVSDADKLPITYNVNMTAERSDVFALPDIASLRKKIEQALHATGMFSEVQYGAKGGADSYHIEFSFHQAGMSVDQSMAVGILAGYTLLLVPTCEILTFDGSAVLSIQGKPIYSTAKAEELRCLIWLPMAPFGLVMNAWSVWHYTETGTVNALCDAIAYQHKCRFLKDATIIKIEER